MRSDIERYLAGRPVQAPWCRRRRPPPTAVRRRRDRRPRRPRRRRRGGADDAAGPGSCVLLGILRGRPGRGARRTCCRGCSSRRPTQVSVPDLVGMTEDEARARDRRRRARGRRADRPRPATTCRKDQVIEQDPEPRRVRRPRHRRSTSWSRRASPRSRCPFVVGQQQGRGARPAARRRASRWSFEEEESDEPAGPGRSRPTRPQARRSPRAPTVTVFYSDGPEKIPTWSGMKQQRGRADAPRRRVRPDVVQSDDDHRARRARSSSRARRPAAGRRGQHGDDRGLDLRGADRDPTDADRHADGDADAADRDPDRAADEPSGAGQPR